VFCVGRSSRPNVDCVFVLLIILVPLGSFLRVDEGGKEGGRYRCVSVDVVPLLLDSVPGGVLSASMGSDPPLCALIRLLHGLRPLVYS